MKNIDIKKIIIILVVLIGGYFIYSFFFGKNEVSSIDKLETFFPFNSEEGSNYNGESDFTNINNPSSSNLTDLSANSVPVLRQITNTPVAGVIIFKVVASSTAPQEESAEKTNQIIRYIEKATGHIYETSTNSPTQTRISNTTIPKIQETLWLDKESLIIRYLDDNNIIKTFSANLRENELGDKQLEGIFLPDDIQSLISFNNGIFYLLENGQGSLGVISDKNNENKKIIFESPLKEWLIREIDDRYINFTTKPETIIPGYSFLLDTKTGSFNKVIGDKKNLSTLTSNLFNILYSEYDKSGLKLSIYNNKEKISSEISLGTFPEKCVWDKENIYIYCGVPLEKPSQSDLINWYKGKVSFSDDVWRINTETNNLEYLVSPMEFEEGEIDIINPILNEENNYLVFMNKKDYSLWGLKLRKNLF